MPLETIWRLPPQAPTALSIFYGALVTHRAEINLQFARPLYSMALNRLVAGHAEPASPFVRAASPGVPEREARLVAAGAVSLMNNLVIQRMPERIERMETTLQRVEHFTREISTRLTYVQTQRWERAPLLAAERMVLRSTDTVSTGAPALRPEAIGGNASLMPPTPVVLPAAQNAPQIDVNRLTEQVMQAIDRRLIAARERRGRV